MASLLRGILLLITSLVWMVSLNPLSIHGQTQGDPKQGKALYLQYCAVCHGSRGLGDGPMAKATSPPATKLAGRQVRDKSDPQLVKAIADGMGSTMPAWRGILTDEQILDVVAYLRSLAG